jgi:adenosylmethionine-8-amino-7-oxononanoate aminotransferase
VFFSDSGSVAVEVALKMALQYWYSCGKPSKNRFLTIRGGYHGDTFGAMSVCDPINGMHSMFRSVLPQHFFAEITNCHSDNDWQDNYISDFKTKIESQHESIAAVIIEPLVQGAGGMRFYCPEYLRQIRKLCDEYDVLLILDEIATGFGRTGSLFAYEQAAICPDIICLGKALTGGYLSLGATMTTQKVAETISGHETGNLMHGPTFMANPLACAVANKSLELLLGSDWLGCVRRIESQLKQELLSCRTLKAVADVRVKGAIGVIEFNHPLDIPTIQPRLVELGVWIRPFNRLLYIMPPYVITANQLRCLTSAMKRVAEELSVKV